MNKSSYRIVGMTCGHCVASVTEEIERIPGVSDVDVDLGTGSVIVTSDTELSEEAVRTAVQEAGYSLASA